MSGEWDLAVRLARAGRGPRIWAIVGGTAMATALLSTASAIHGALYTEDLSVVTQERANLWAVLAFSILPASVLMLTAARASAAARDRRLAALRMIGASARTTGLVAGLENGLLATVGAVFGLVLFAIVAPVITAVVAAGPDWFGSPLVAAPMTSLATATGVMALTSTLAVASARSALRDPLRNRSEASPRPVSRLRLALIAPPLVILGLLAWKGGTDSWLRSPLGLGLLVVGSISGAIAVAAVTPLLARLLARAVADRAGPATLLAARAVQNDASSSGRLVAGLGVTVYLLLAALAVVSAWEASPPNRYALQTLREGPQVIQVWPAGDDPVTGQVTPLTVEQLEPLADEPGVRAVLPVYQAAGECGPNGACQPKVFVGTCAGLSEVMSVTGCHDDRAGVISSDSTEEGRDPSAALAPTWTDLAGYESLDLAFEPAGLTVHVPLGPTLAQDSAATERRWVWPSDYTVFIPATLVRAAGVEPIGAQVIADGGPDVQQAVAEAAGTDLRVAPFPRWDYDNAMRVRTAVTTLSALAIGVGLLGLGLNAADRAVAQRRAVARHVAIGMPAHTLRIAQLLQVLAPLVIAIALATAFGALLARAVAALGGWPDVANGVQLGLVATATLIAAIVTAGATVPIIRTRLTPDLLRRE